LPDLLLDTNIFLWATMESHKLSHNVRQAISDTGSRLFLSAASFWELLLKHQKYGARFPVTEAEILRGQMSIGCELAPIGHQELTTLAKLPIKEEHKDPWDRMIVAQAIARDMTLVATDPNVLAYQKVGLVVWVGAGA
jgi:PIN domain nuclease of toxin-antitoxin system